ncbi:MAG: hypothetical protein IJA34_00710 [Lachnospiraceae bacterium]|nr:hypothetical protein [Lachnospiraceae bacterium]
MEFWDIIRTFFEFLAVVLVIIGFINEKKLIKFENQIAEKIRIFFEHRKERKTNE